MMDENNDGWNNNTLSSYQNIIPQFHKSNPNVDHIINEVCQSPHEQVVK